MEVVSTNLFTQGRSVCNRNLESTNKHFEIPSATDLIVLFRLPCGTFTLKWNHVLFPFSCDVPAQSGAVHRLYSNSSPGSTRSKFPVL